MGIICVFKYHLWYKRVVEYLMSASATLIIIPDMLKPINHLVQKVPTWNIFGYKRSDKKLTFINLCNKLGSLIWWPKLLKNVTYRLTNLHKDTHSQQQQITHTHTHTLLWLYLFIRNKGCAFITLEEPKYSVKL